VLSSSTPTRVLVQIFRLDPVFLLQCICNP
jgi:hypothetical protein